MFVKQLLIYLFFYKDNFFMLKIIEDKELAKQIS